ncbi:hypothetical protein [Cryobacterium sp. SO1]|uniref:hypothetical protein n=1 Tax=Cryobacterium sp. SO1 TaxID=1897061 RepID=UPI00210D1DB4|nr:hypothetical protein [Cryobacterium sp. SO1]
MLADLRLWSRRRRLVATAVAVSASGGLILAASMVSSAPGLGAPWWAFVGVAGGGILLGLIVAGYLEAPIGAEATVCDLRWPLLGLLGLYLASDARALVPTLSAEARPVLALASVAVLVWALAERMRGERHALAAGRQRETVPHGETDAGRNALRTDGALSTDHALSTDGETCGTCRPLFPTRPHSLGGPTP